MVKSDITQSASPFSNAFRNRAQDEFAFELFSNFPSACCEYASLLLAWFLCTEHPEIQIDIVTSELVDNSQRRHTWLIVNACNIDITADQFDVRLPALFVTSSGGWHERYTVIERASFNRKFYDDYWQEERLKIIADYEFLAHQARESKARQPV